MNIQEFHRQAYKHLNALRSLLEKMKDNGLKECDSQQIGLFIKINALEASVNGTTQDDLIATPDDAIVETITAKIEAMDDASSILDEKVIDCASALASDANNGGVQAQVEFLLDNGCGMSEILAET